MSKKVVKRKRDIKRDIPKSKSWDDAIADAERMMAEGKARLRKLRGSILVFRDRRDSGEPFPGGEMRISSRKGKADESRS
jgi:hypothetical protein